MFTLLIGGAVVLTALSLVTGLILGTAERDPDLKDAFGRLAVAGFAGLAVVIAANAAFIHTDENATIDGTVVAVTDTEAVIETADGRRFSEPDRGTMATGDDVAVTTNASGTPINAFATAEQAQASIARADTLPFTATTRAGIMLAVVVAIQAAAWLRNRAKRTEQQEGDGHVRHLHAA